MRKISMFLLLALLLNICPIYADTNNNVKLTLKSKSAVLISGDSGDILYEKDCNKKLPPASITKIMLLILISEKLKSGEIDLKDETTITRYASSMGGSQVFLEENEVQTVNSLLKAICMRSANDASVAMAEMIFGSEESCVNAMNEKAIELGMENTNFMNVTGLPCENHYTTALDIAKMTKELLKYNYASKYMVTWMDSIMVGKNKDVKQVLVNTNRLINHYNGLLGVKTGFTQAAKYCLSAAARRKGTMMIAVVLGCDDTKVRFREAAKLMNHGFASYKNIMFFEKEKPITQVKVDCCKKENIDVISKENISLLVTNNCKIDDYSIKYSIDEHLKAPLDYLTPIGKLTISKDGKILKEYDLYPESDIKKQPFFEFYFKILSKKLFK